VVELPKSLPLIWVIILSLTMFFLGGFFTAFGDDLYRYTKDLLTSQFGTPKLTNATLKVETIALYEDIMQFVGERYANEPSIDFDHWEESTNNRTKYSQEK
jgi:hypothetical protein